MQIVIDISDELKNKIDACDDDSYSSIIRWYDTTLYDAIRNGTPLPTADVKPVVRGEWIYQNDNIAIPTGYWECSICGKGKLLYEQNFCPNCGADMRGKTDGKDKQ